MLNTIERAVPAGEVIHVILDNYGSQKPPKVLRWLARLERRDLGSERSIPGP